MIPSNQSKKHQWIFYDKYVDIHTTIIEKYRNIGDFINENTIEFNAFLRYDKPLIKVQGQLGCLGEIIIDVLKYLELDNNLSYSKYPLVKTNSYAYQVFFRNGNPIFRYDNNHPDSLHDGCKDPHHKHIFDFKTGKELGIEWIGVDKWLTLGEVIQETHDFYVCNYKMISNPYNYPVLGRRDNPPSLEL